MKHRTINKEKRTPCERWRQLVMADVKGKEIKDWKGKANDRKSGRK